MDLGTAKTLRTDLAKSVSASQPVLDDVTEMSGRSRKRQEAEPEDDRDNEQWVQGTGGGQGGTVGGRQQRTTMSRGSRGHNRSLGPGNQGATGGGRRGNGGLRTSKIPKLDQETGERSVAPDKQPLVSGSPTVNSG